MTPGQKFIEDRLKPPLLHGDEKHQEWLKQELRKWAIDIDRLIEANNNDNINQEVIEKYF